MTNQETILSKLLIEKFNKVALTSEETAKVLGTSVKSLELDRAHACGIPYTRRNNKTNGQVMYSITSIARTLVENEIKTI